MSAHAPLTPLSGDIGTPPPAETLPPPATAPPAQDRNDLELRRERLARDLAQLQWDLGGLTYEMAIRDHFRLDVLIRQAGMLQDVDAELAETERLIALDESSAAGTCPNCTAMFARGSSFCWRCGTQLLVQFDPMAGEVVEPAAAPAPAANPYEPATQEFSQVAELRSGDPLAGPGDTTHFLPVD